MNLVSDLLRIVLVHPCGGGQLGRRGRLADEPFGVPLVGGVEHDRPGGVRPLGVAVVARVRDVAFRLPRSLRLPSAPEGGVCRLCGTGTARSQPGFIADAALASIGDDLVTCSPPTWVV